MHLFYCIGLGAIQYGVRSSVQDPEVTQVAESNDKTVAQTLLRWGLEHGTSVIPKSSNPSHIQASVVATLDSTGNLNHQFLWLNLIL